MRRVNNKGRGASILFPQGFKVRDKHKKAAPKRFNVMARLRCISGLVVAKREGIARSPNADGAALVDRAAQQRLTQIIE